MNTSKDELKCVPLYHPPARSCGKGGWCLGSESFGKQMLELAEAQPGENHPGELRAETAQAKARRIIAEELQARSWTEAELGKRRNSDPAKLAIAVRLRKETTLTVKTIAGLLHLGTPNSARVRLRHSMAAKCANPQQTTLVGV